MNVIDLFAGVGTFSHIFEKEKFKVIFANDISECSEKMYNENNKTFFIKKDINEIDVKTIPKHDILTAGFPCQPFSIAGKKEGFKDKRTNVFWKLLEIIKFHKPRIVILENVKNLKSHDKGKTFTIITDKIEEINYKIKYKVLNTCKISLVPQNRERIFILCFRELDDYNKFEFDFPIIKNQQLKYFLENNIDKKYYYNERYKIWNKIKDEITDCNTVYQYRRTYIRKNKKNLSPTLTFNMGSGGHNVPLIRDENGIRKLTPRECFNLQGFPKNFKLPNLSDSKLYNLVGNSVSYPVVELIVKKIKLLIS